MAGMITSFDFLGSLLEPTYAMAVMDSLFMVVTGESKISRINIFLFN